MHQLEPILNLSMWKASENQSFCKLSTSWALSPMDSVATAVMVGRDCDDVFSQTLSVCFEVWAEDEKNTLIQASTYLH